MNKRLSALLLAAGFGTRLRPITNNIPKCLVKINNEPILKRWLREVKRQGCEECIVNTHYLSEKVEKFISENNFGRMKINITYEEDLLGTAGTLIENLSFFKDKIGILIHVDNATNFDLKELLEAHKRRTEGCILTMLTFNSKNPEACGIIEKNSKGVMTNFHEKINNPPSDCANGAIYIFEDDFIKWLDNNKYQVKDFSSDILPKLLNKVQTYHTNKVYLDIGTQASLEEAKNFFNDE